MRRTVLAPLALAAVLLGVQPASAGAGTGTGTGIGTGTGSGTGSGTGTGTGSGTGTGTGWEPAPSAPWDVDAGLRCGFPVHGEPVIDEVMQRVLETYPDGATKRVAYKGDLVVRVTNTETGAFYDADASGSAVVEHRPDGSQFWTVHGPVLVGIGEGNLPRGLYIIDGVYTLDISSTGYRTVNLAHGTTDDLCSRVG